MSALLSIKAKNDILRGEPPKKKITARGGGRGQQNLVCETQKRVFLELGKGFKKSDFATTQGPKEGLRCPQGPPTPVFEKKLLCLEMIFRTLGTKK